MRLKILPKWAKLAGLCLMLGTMGCMGTKHVAIPNGSTGQILKRGGTVKAAFPGADGRLEVGQYEVQAGDLIRRPKTEAEVVEALKSAGARFDGNP